MKLLFGSAAIHCWFGDNNMFSGLCSDKICGKQLIPNNVWHLNKMWEYDPTDIDFIDDGTELTNYHDDPENFICSDFTHLKREYFWTDAFEYLRENNPHKVIIDPVLLYTIKVSHAMYDINWQKHMMHIAYLKKSGCYVDEEFYKLLVDDWKKKPTHNRPTVTLNKPISEFFSTDMVARAMDHDELHDLIKFKDEPLFMKIQPDHSVATCSKESFDKLNYDDQILLCLEEIYVTAMERYIIPNNIYWRLAKFNAFKHLITSMTSGWYNRFLIENNERIMKYSKQEDTRWISLLQQL